MQIKVTIIATTLNIFANLEKFVVCFRLFTSAIMPTTSAVIGTKNIMISKPTVLKMSITKRRNGTNNARTKLIIPKI